MEPRELRDMLMHQADELMKLADRIGEGGRPLNTRERTLARTALYRPLKEQLSYIEQDFLNGEMELNDWYMNPLMELFRI